MIKYKMKILTENSTATAYHLSLREAHREIIRAALFCVRAEETIESISIEKMEEDDEQN